MDWASHNLAQDGDVVSVAAWQEFDWLRQGFSLACAGNMSFAFGQKDQVEAAQRALAPALIMVQQVHGNTVIDVDRQSVAVEADAMITRQEGNTLAVLVADCVPLLFVDPVTKTVAVAHAGRRGTQAGIAKMTFKQMLKRGSRPQDVQVAIGPSIGPCCYVFDNEPLDLWSLNERQLQEVGAQTIIRTNLCTKHTNYFFSHQRDPKAGRFAGFIGIASY